jgi:hypothetical protein
MDKPDGGQVAAIRFFLYVNQGWTDARLYDIWVNTSRIGIYQAADLILDAIKAKLTVLTTS